MGECVKLDRVSIKNFRSINNLDIDFRFGCQILIGINECGKSNVLRALNLLDQNIVASPSDLRIERHDEDPVTKGHVWFVFKLDKDEIDEVRELVIPWFCEESRNAPFLIDEVGSNLVDWLNGKNEILYAVDLPGSQRRLTSWSVSSSLKLALGWFRNRVSESIEIRFDSDKVVKVPGRGFVFVTDPNVLPSGGFSPATLKEVNDVFIDASKNIFLSRLPKCVFWRYSDEYLLPSSVDLSTFSTNPDSCVPLKSMFELAGYPAASLSEIMSAAQAQGHHRFVNILEKVASAATAYLRTVWPDYKTVRLRLEPNGGSISPMVLDDTVRLDMANRSDGFKRFVSFLLQISAKVHTEELVGALVLVDEPEIALHPSGARSLMKELIRIGENNRVVFSTHSIFMVDKDEIGRHLIVEKKQDVTVASRAVKSRVQDEEVLYSAIGYSIFEALNAQNVVFEGWRDKVIFDVLARSRSKGDKDVRAKLSRIGKTFAEGVKDVRNVARFLELAARPCLIISDSDAPALQAKKAYCVPGAWGEWVTLQDIFPESPIFTGEDLVSRAALVSRLNKIRASYNNLPELSVSFFTEGESSVAAMKRWLRSGGLDGGDLESAMNHAKELTFDNLKRSELIEVGEHLVDFVLGYDFSSQVEA